MKATWPDPNTCRIDLTPGELSDLVVALEALCGYGAQWLIYSPDAGARADLIASHLQFLAAAQESRPI